MVQPMFIGRSEKAESRGGRPSSWSSPEVSDGFLDCVVPSLFLSSLFQQTEHQKAASLSMVVCKVAVTPRISVGGRRITPVILTERRQSETQAWDT